MPTLPETIAGILKSSPDALIVCHVGPDGDCLGGSLALALACETVGVRAVVGSADGVPEAYAVLPGAARIVAVPPAEKRFNVGVAVECSNLDRAGTFAEALRGSRTLINIDHHLSNAGYGNIVYWDTSAAAVGEQVHEIIRAMGVALTPAIAQCLLTAIVTDTGSFRFPNTTPRTLRLAADLMDLGASVHAVVERVYETRTPGSLRLTGAALRELTLSADGRIAWTVVTPEMLQQAGALTEDTAGLVGMLRQIRGVKVAFLFEVTPAGVRVGIRSRDAVRSNVIAETFGGGGHKGAAGFTAEGELDDVIARTLAEAEKELRAQSDARA
jgi:phosphoesterase RecJ-like protein